MSMTETVKHEQSSSIPQTLCMDTFFLALVVHIVPSVHSLAGSTCCAWTWSTFSLYVLNGIACVRQQLLNRNWTVWGQHSQTCAHAITKKAEIPQSAPVEVLCKDYFDDRCIRNIYGVMNMHVPVFANIWRCHVYKLSCIMYISWACKYSPT